MIYINEQHVIKPADMKEYVNIFKNNLVPIMASYNINLYGLWQTWRTNEFWIFWELPEMSTLDVLDKAEREDKDLINYMEHASESRIYYSNRILRPAKFMLDLATLKKGSYKGEVYGLTRTPIDPPKINEWLELFEKYGMLHEEHTGKKTIGYWNGGIGTPMQLELTFITQLAYDKNWSTQDKYREAFEQIPEVKEWWSRAWNFRLEHSVSHLVPVYLPY